MVAILLGVLCMSTAAAPSPSSASVYVVGSSVNLRAEANAQAKLIAKARIGQRCSVLEARGEWVKLSCPFGAGFAKAELVAAEPPSSAALLAILRDEKAPRDARLQAGQRYLTLTPPPQCDENWVQAYISLFMRSELERLSAAHGKLVRDVSFTIPANASDGQSFIDGAVMSGPNSNSHTVWEYDGSRGFSLATTEDCVLHTAYFEVDWAGKRARVYYEAGNPVEANVAKWFLLERNLDWDRTRMVDPCQLEPLSAEAAKTQLGLAAEPNFASLTAHTTCLLEAEAKCNQCRASCPYDRSRAACVSACQPAQAGVSECRNLLGPRKAPERSSSGN